MSNKRRRLHDFLVASSHEIAQRLLEQLPGSLAPHYEQMDRDQLTRRVVSLVESFVSSIDRDAVPFVAYIHEIAQERISEGVFLEEVQLALTILEEQVWYLVVDKTPPDDQVAHLRRVSFTIGAAKDQLARTYLRRAQHAEQHVSLLEAGLEALFQGTDSAPDLEDPPRPGGVRPFA